MTLLIEERAPAPVAPVEDNGGAPARRAIVRWAWRMFRREWRRQALVLALLIVALAATIVGLGVASNAARLKAHPTFGTANSILTLPGADPELNADISAIRSRVGVVDVIGHQSVPIPGSVASMDLRSQDPNGSFGRVTLRLDSGRYPTGPGEVAVTKTFATTFDVHIGGVWTLGARTWRVVGQVENPLDLTDQFALVAPGQASPPDQVSILANAGRQLEGLKLPSGTGLDISGRGAGDKTANEVLILVLGTLGLLFVGLMAVAGFTVMAQRRLRAMGMLGALGATDRHVRLVLLANGAVVGATAAIGGAAVGLGSWFAFVPTLQHLAEHRVDSFDLPWWAIAAAMALTFLTAVAAAWWPARAVARVSVVTALSGRPPRPQPAHRFAALGGVLTGTGVVLLAFSHQRRPAFIIGGTVGTAIGLLFLAPLAIRLLAAAASRTPVAVRLALRDLARYQARSGAALGAVTLAVGIAATIAISAAAAETPTGAGNLPTSELMLYLSPQGPGNPVPALTESQQRLISGQVQQLANTLGARDAVPLAQAYRAGSELNPLSPGQVSVTPGQPVAGGQSGGYTTAALARVHRVSHGEEISRVVTLYVATPQVLAAYGIRPSQIDPNTDVISSRTDLAGLEYFGADLLLRGAPSKSGDGSSSRGPALPLPKVQVLSQLPPFTSAPSALITEDAMRTLGLQQLPAAWLVRTAGPLTPRQIAAAQKAAASAGVYVETRTRQKSLTALRNGSTAVGIVLALGVLGMTVGLIRSETASDLRTLAATGAGSTTRRTITAATAGALGLLGALLGTAGAYAALVAWHRSDLSPLHRIPAANLALIVVGLPVVAAVAGWLVAGREPATMAKQPLE